jgi:glycosyltransferase involved in cell wall biosynthesis
MVTFINQLHRLLRPLLERRAPWRLTHRGGYLNTCIYTPLRRSFWRLTRPWERAYPREDITIVIPVRNRVSFRLRNTLACVARQDYPGDLIKAVVVDYDSDAEYVSELQAMCAQGGARYRRVDGQPRWNKSHCLNVALRECNTRYFMVVDNDILLAPNYLSEALRELQRDPLQVIYNQMLDLSETQTATLAAGNGAIDLARLKPQAKARSHGFWHESINVALTYFLRWIGGFDENYWLWGGEDNDIAKRFYLMGLAAVTLKDRTYYLHQWHPRFESLNPVDATDQYKRNMAYFERMQSIKRNSRGWGQAAPIVTVNV